MLKPIVAGAALAAAIISTPALAQKPPTGTGKINHNVGDPNERICENLTVVGSRLSVKRVCGTRAEWADRKRQDREATEAAQKGRYCTSEGGAQC